MHMGVSLCVHTRVHACVCGHTCVCVCMGIDVCMHDCLREQQQKHMCKQVYGHVHVGMCHCPLEQVQCLPLGLPLGVSVHAQLAKKSGPRPGPSSRVSHRWLSW